MNQVAHFNTAFYCSEKMLMMPEGVRSEALLINKVSLLLHMGYFSYPMHGYQTEQADAVTDHHARVHAIAGAEAGKDFEAELGRGDAVEIGG